MEQPAIYLSRITDLEQRPDLVSQYRRWLSPEEHRRFSRMRNPNQQQRFLLARGIVRRQLANRLSVRPERVPVVLSSQGKPCLARIPDVSTECEFSLSHSGQWVAVAFAHRAPTGVDLEHPHRHRSLLAIARQFFHPDETRLLEALTGAALQNTFYRFWTQKEAYLKARGTGIAGGLANVSFAKGGDAFVAGAPYFSGDCFSGERFRSKEAKDAWHCFHWYNPTQDSLPCFLSLAINTQWTETPTVWRSLPEAGPDQLISAKSN